MWLLARLLIAAGALLYRLLFRQIPSSYPLQYKGIRYSQKDVKSKKGITKRYLETPVDSSFICCLTPETRLHKFMKTLGFGEEIQTQDEAFDAHIYVVGDHPLTGAYLTSKQSLRDQIRKLIQNKLKSISITGRSLRFEIFPTVEPATLLDDLVELRTSVAQIQRDYRAGFSDPFYLKALILQSAVAALFAYAVTGFIEMRMMREDYHPSAGLLISAAIFGALALTVIFLGAHWVLLSRSSHAPQIMLENGLALLFSLPFGGFQMVSDLNRTLDHSEPITVTCSVTKKYTERHKRRRSSYTTYHLNIDSPANADALTFYMPSKVSINSSLYYNIKEGGSIDFEIGQGWLGVPWYRSMRPHPQSTPLY